MVEFQREDPHTLAIIYRGQRVGALYSSLEGEFTIELAGNFPIGVFEAIMAKKNELERDVLPEGVTLPMTEAVVEGLHRMPFVPAQNVNRYLYLESTHAYFVVWNSYFVKVRISPQELKSLIDASHYKGDGEHGTMRIFVSTHVVTFYYDDRGSSMAVPRDLLEQTLGRLIGGT